MSTLSSDFQKIKRQFQVSLNKRLDKMSLKSISGNDYDSTEHFDNCIYFVLRDENTIELYKGDIRISGVGGLLYNIDSALVFDTNWASGTGASYSDFIKYSDYINPIDTADILNASQHPDTQGVIDLVTADQEHSLESFSAINTAYRIAYSPTAGNQTLSNVPQYQRMELIVFRPSTPAVERFEIFSMQLYLLFSRQGNNMTGTIDEILQKNSTIYNNALYVKRYINGQLHSEGIYAPDNEASPNVITGRIAKGRAPNNCFGCAISDIIYSSTFNMFWGPLYLYSGMTLLQEYSKSDAVFGQLGITRDIITGDSLSPAYLIFSANTPELNIYKILKGEAI